MEILCSNNKQLLRYVQKNGEMRFYNTSPSLFQLTRSFRGATTLCSLENVDPEISTHTPFAGRDLGFPTRHRHIIISTHTPLAGRDPTICVKRVTPVQDAEFIFSDFSGKWLFYSILQFFFLFFSRTSPLFNITGGSRYKISAPSGS